MSKKTGRPPLPENERLVRFVRTDITEDEDRKFRQIAHNLGIKPSLLLRAIFRAWMKKQ